MKSKEFKGTMFKMDGGPNAQGEIFDLDSVIIQDKSLPVYIGDTGDPTNVVGWAKPSKDGSDLKYEMTVSLEHPKVLEKLLPQLKPCITATIGKREGNVIKSFNPLYVSLDFENRDPRIKKLGEER